MTKEYSTVVDKITDLPDGGEVELTIRDLTPGPRKYDARIVRAKVASSAGKLPGGDVLWVRSMVGIQYPEPWAIQVLEELEDTLPGRPFSEMFR